MAGGFRSVSLSKPLRNEIDEFLKEHPKYRSAAEFVSEAARLRMEELTRLKQGAQDARRGSNEG